VCCSPREAGEAVTANSRWSWIAALVLGCLAQLLLWSISEPAYLFSDFYKAYYPVADHLWFDGPRVPLPPSEAVVVGFVNLPIVGWLFVPLLAFGEDGSSWAWLAVGAVVCVLAWHLLVRRIAPGHGALLLLLFLLNGPLVN